MSHDFGSPIREAIATHLGHDDDPTLWAVAIDQIYADAAYLSAAPDRPVVSVLGCCSRWRRPHQTRWSADGGFAWPTGYGEGPALAALPEHDWSVRLAWDAADAGWRPDETPTKRAFELRVTLPARTTQHAQAAVHTVWRPGSPVQPDQPLTQLYGFRRGELGWALTASTAPDVPYALAAERRSSDP